MSRQILIIWNLIFLLAGYAFAGDGTISNADLADNASVALSKLELIQNNSVVGNTSGGVANPRQLNSQQVTSILDAFSGDSGSGGVKGAVPAPSAGDTGLNKFLHANGGWSVISLNNYLYLPGMGTGGQAIENPVEINSTTANQTLFSLDPQTGSNWDFRVEGDLFRLDRGANSYMVMTGGYMNLTGTRTPRNQVEIQNAATNTTPLTGLTSNVANLPLLATVNNSSTANNWSANCFAGASTASTALDSCVVGVHEAHTNGAESGHLAFFTRNAGVLGQAFKIGKDSVVSMPAYTSGVAQFGAGGEISAVAPSTSGNILTSNGTSWVSQAAPAATIDMSYEISNAGLSVSSVAGAFVIALKQSDGSTDPSTGTSAVNIAFRDSSATTGGFVQRSVTSALSLTIPDGATLGHVSGVTQWFCVYAIDNSGTVELAVSSNCQLNEGNLQTSTSIGTGSDSFVGFYSSTGRTSKAIRLLGVVEHSQSTAGTHNFPATRVEVNTGIGIKDPYSVWRKTFTFTPSAGFGTAANNNIWWRRVGNKMELSGSFDAGTVAASTASIALPSGIALDPDFLHSENHTAFGSMFELVGTGQFYTTNVVPVAFYDLSDVNTLFLSISSATVSTFTKTNGNGMQANGGAMAIEYIAFPVEGWEL
jgi:hypothetical protein